MSLANKLKCVKLSYYWLTIILITADVSVMAADDSIKASEKKDDLVSSLSPPFLVSPKGKKKEDDSQSQGQDSQSVPLLTKDSEGVGSESEEDPSAIKEHLYSLKENGPLCNTLPDSRGICRELKIYGHDFSPWHVNAIERLKEYTPKVRKALEFQGVESKSNLLQHMINLFFIDNGTEQAELLQVEDDKEIWVSGWPGSKNRQVLKSKIPEVSFKFLDDFLPADKRNLTAKQKVPFLLPHIIDGFCLENHGYLIKERHEYLKNSLRRAQNDEKKGDMQHFNQHFLHTEQGVLRYLTSDLFQQKIIKIIKDHPSSREIVMVVNMASTNSVCLHCADRIFRESEWGQGFLKDLQQKAKIPLKIHFLASAYVKYVDDLKFTDDSKSLREKLKKDLLETQQKIGFNGGCRINFMGTFEGRQPFDHELPLIAHTII